MSTNNNLVKYTPEWIKEAFKYERSGMPVGVQILVQIIAFIIAVLSTIYIAPSINADFEKEKRRSEFYVKAIDALNDDTKDLLESVREVI